MVKLSKRLQAVADLAACGIEMWGAASSMGDLTSDGGGVREAVDLTVADVGTDHGYVPIYLVQQGICSSAIAMDVRQGPLLRAREHIQANQVGQYIETRLSDGLEKLEPGEAQVIVIAGMGGALMERILSGGASNFARGTFLVLQPQSELMRFRSYLQEKFDLLKEDFIFEDGKYYPMMLVEYVGEARERTESMDIRYGPTELCYGPLLLRQRHPVLRKYLLRQREQKREILRRLEESASPEVSARRVPELLEALARIQEGLEYYESQEERICCAVT